MALSALEREYVNAIVRGVTKEFKAEMKGVKELFEVKNENVCGKIKELKKDSDEHEERIDAIENKIAYYIGKSAGVALVISGIGWALSLYFRAW